MLNIQGHLKKQKARHRVGLLYHIPLQQQQSPAV